MRIAVLEDDSTQADTLVDWLTAAGHDAHLFRLGRDLLRQTTRESFDAFLIDWILPDQSGYEVLRCLRQERGISAPVLFVTSRDSEEDIVSGLNSGADDYMIKPVRRLELLSRLEAVWRRFRQREERQQLLESPPYRIDMERRIVFCNSAPVENLTEKEFALVVFLFQNIGRLLSRGHLLEAIWGLSAAVPTRTLDTHISRVRKKLELQPTNGFRLVPAYNYGYRLERVAASPA